MQSVELLGVQNVCQLGVTIPGHGRLVLQLGVFEANALVDGKPLVAVRGEVHDANLANRGRGTGRLEKGQQVVRKKPVAQIVCLFSISH